ncbi:MAG: PEP/pyruvate-binding domain-containing protein, partial [Bacteroidota bacterium]
MRHYRASRLKKFYFTDTEFDNLMKNRIYHVLLISSNYDAFVLEDDGRIDEQIFNEYVSLNLRYPPQFFQVDTEEKAFRALEDQSIDLIITMLSAEASDTFALASRLKTLYPEKPIVVLTPFSRKVSMQLKNEDLSAIDYVFSWLGNADILLAIIKLIEDRMNVENDVKEGVQVIILVEDSVRFYSSYLPNIYKIIFKQSKEFMTEGLNEHQQMLRMRGRPKILLATNYEDAMSMYEQYRKNLLGVISDMSYKHHGVRDVHAGLKLSHRIKEDDKYMPILLQSSDSANEELAKEIRVGFLHKKSKELSRELRAFITEYFAFGEFVFKDPNTDKEVSRASDLKELQEKIFEVPDDSLKYHVTRNHISKWLNARALFPIAQLFKELSYEDFDDLDEIRRYIFDAIASYRMSRARGIIAEFRRDRFDEYLSFTRIGNGSIGGKARGLAFLDSVIKRHRELDSFENVITMIPRTVVLCTDIFDEFMEENKLYKIALSDMDDEHILEYFLNARLPFRIHEDLYTFINVVSNPIAVRSSSLLEDSHYQPFAGIYSTYMLPNVSNDERQMIEMLSNAIKSVYASAFFKASKSYMEATANVIDEEKMGIVMQEVCGTQYGDRFYPTFSGVARSINFYPIEEEKPYEGIANVAMGLGKYIVDGGQTLRFSPRYPKKILQLSDPKMALSETQRQFYALDLNPESFVASTDDSANLMKLRVKNAERDGSLKYLASTFDYHSNQVVDTLQDGGMKVITFAKILKYNAFPLADILQKALEIGQREMSLPVEIEFAVNLDTPEGVPAIFNLLQIRPIVDIN